MVGWWCIIALVNLAWCSVLWLHRRDNHTWTLPVYAAFTLADTLMLLWSPYGLALGPGSGPVWVFAAAVAWMSWFSACLLAAVRLWLGRVPWWVGAAVAVPGVLVAGSESLGASQDTRRTLMHVFYEPMCLIGAFLLIRSYVQRVVKSGCESGIDYLAFLIGVTSIILLLKLGLMLDDGLLVYWMAYAFHVLFMVTIIVYYVWKRKYMIPWLLSRS